MGVEFAIVHNETNEAYELGKGCFYDWTSEGPPKTRADVAASLAETFEPEPDERAWFDRVVSEVWTFIETHPGCYVISDTGDDFWSEDPKDNPYPNDLRIFRQVGSRYDVQQRTTNPTAKEKKP